MPQIYIEHSDNIKLVKFKEILKIINGNIAEIVNVSPDRCKGRIIKYSDYLIGVEDNPDDAFIFIHVGIQATRSDDQKNKIGNMILEILKEHALPKLKEQALKCSPRIEVRGFDLYLFSDWTS